MKFNTTFICSNTHGSRMFAGEGIKGISNSFCRRRNPENLNKKTDTSNLLKSEKQKCIYLKQ